MQTERMPIMRTEISAHRVVFICMVKRQLLSNVKNEVEINLTDKPNYLCEDKINNRETY